MLRKIERKAKIAGCYKVKHPIENFKVRIKIIQQQSILADLFDDDTDVSDPNYLDKEERIFHWQEKVLGPAEIQFYADEQNCLTASQKKYHQSIVNDQVEISRIYSYINEDACFPEKDIFVKLKPYESKLSKKNQCALPVYKNRKPFAMRYNKAVVDECPRWNRIRTNHYLYKEQIVMHIVVDLSSKTEEPKITNEALLCTITYDRISKTLIVNPDFTKEDEPYCVNLDEMSYDYWIYHASEGLSDEDLQKQLAVLRKKMQKMQILKNANKYKELKVPPVGVLRFVINFEIASARKFFFDALFVNYFVTLPQNWSVQNEKSLMGRTQRCKMKDGKAHFSYPVEIILDYHWDQNENESSVAWPQIFISAASLDNWTRYRIEGYGSLFLPSQPGIHKITLNTWRPVGDFINTLRRFFTGGTYELEDISYCGVPQDHDDTYLQKSGLNVVPSGSIKLRFSIVRQCLQDAEIPQAQAIRNRVDDRGSNPEEVLAQFKAARERMVKKKDLRSKKQD